MLGSRYDRRAMLVIAVIMLVTLAVCVWVLHWSWHEELLAVALVAVLCWWGWLWFDSGVH